MDSKDNNPAKLIQFIVAVCDKYDKLCNNYNSLETNWDELPASKNQKKAMIQYLHDQNAVIFAEIDTLQRRLKRQSIVSDQSIVNPPVNKYQVSSNLSVISASTATKQRCFKLQDLPTFNEKTPIYQ